MFCFQALAAQENLHARNTRPSTHTLHWVGWEPTSKQPGFAEGGEKKAESPFPAPLSEGSCFCSRTLRQTHSRSISSLGLLPPAALQNLEMTPRGVRTKQHLQKHISPEHAVPDCCFTRKDYKAKRKKITQSYSTDIRLHCSSAPEKSHSTRDVSSTSAYHEHGFGGAAAPPPRCVVALLSPTGASNNAALQNLAHTQSNPLGKQSGSSTAVLQPNPAPQECPPAPPVPTLCAVLGRGD